MDVYFLNGLCLHLFSVGGVSLSDKQPVLPCPAFTALALIWKPLCYHLLQ